MSRAFQRYEILLPLRFNDGHPVPDDLVATLLLEMRTRFGAVSCETQTIRGHWQHEGVEFRDDLIRVFVDVPRELDCRAYFLDLKERTKAAFQQVEIWITTYPVDAI